MEYEIEIHDVWIPVTREDAERIFTDWEFANETGTGFEHGMDRLNGLASGAECKLVSGHVKFRRTS